MFLTIYTEMTEILIFKQFIIIFNVLYAQSRHVETLRETKCLERQNISDILRTLNGPLLVGG